MKRVCCVLALAALPLCGPAMAQEKTTPRSQLFQKVIDCRAIADNAARLACYDAQVSVLDQAEAKRDIVIVDRAEVRKARKGLFGLSLPDLGGLFGRGEDVEKEEFTQIESTIKSASTQGYGKWVIVIEDGARWVQTDSESIRMPKPGQPIRIRKASMGGYFANINNQPAIRVLRTN
jgi:hypothetical protein